MECARVHVVYHPCIGWRVVYVCLSMLLHLHSQLDMVIGDGFFVSFFIVDTHTHTHTQPQWDDDVPCGVRYKLIRSRSGEQKIDFTRQISTLIVCCLVRYVREYTLYVVYYPIFHSIHSYGLCRLHRYRQSKVYVLSNSTIFIPIQTRKLQTTYVVCSCSGSRST